MGVLLDRDMAQFCRPEALMSRLCDRYNVMYSCHYVIFYRYSLSAGGDPELASWSPSQIAQLGWAIEAGSRRWIRGSVHFGGPCSTLAPPVHGTLKHEHGMSRPRAIVPVLALLPMATWAIACGDGAMEPSAPPPDPPRPTTVTVTPATAELTALGGTVRFSAEVRDQNGRVLSGSLGSRGRPPTPRSRR